MLLFTVLGKFRRGQWKEGWEEIKAYPPDLWERLTGIFDEEKISDDSLKKINDELKNLTTQNLDDVYTLSTRSLEEVKSLTEYEDDKANRILTAIAFISAFAGALFAALISKKSVALLLLSYDKSLLVLICDYLFAVFVFSILAGAFFVLKAIRPRFNIPKESKDPLRSYLFFDPILKAGPSKWVKGFTDKSSPNDLKFEYAKGNIVEAYLVADKIRQKLKALQPGIELLRLSIIALLAWFTFFLWIFLASDISDPKPGPSKQLKVAPFANRSSHTPKPVIAPRLKKRHAHETYTQQRYSSSKCCCCD